MARREEWQREVAEGVRHEGWSLHGPTRIVKITRAEQPVAQRLGGFFCLEKSLLGATPSGLELRLGFRSGHFSQGCRVYRFLRLPMAAEVEYELTARYPNGLAANLHMDDPTYPPGSPAVHQWRLVVELPVSFLTLLGPGDVYRYPHA